MRCLMGPMPAVAPLLLPIEIFSHLARVMSLTIRLFANMYAGEQVTMVFLSLTFDHRLVDGAPAARFLQRVKLYLEKPYLWLTQ